MEHKSITNEIPLASRSDNYPAAMRLLDEAAEAAVRVRPEWEFAEPLVDVSRARLELRSACFWAYDKPNFPMRWVTSDIQPDLPRDIPFTDAVQQYAVSILIQRLEAVLAELRAWEATR